MKKWHYGKKGIAWMLALAFAFTGLFCTTTVFGGQEEPPANNGETIVVTPEEEVPPTSGGDTPVAPAPPSDDEPAPVDESTPADEPPPSDPPTTAAATPLIAGDYNISMVWTSGGVITENGQKIVADPSDNMFSKELRLLLTFKVNENTDLKPDGVEIKIPRSILKAGPGREYAWVNFNSSISQGQELEIGLGKADIKEHESGFYFTLTSDEIVIKNYKAISASNEFQCEIVYFYTPSQIENGYSGTLKAQYSLGDGSVGETALLSYQINTKVAAGRYIFFDPRCEKFETWPVGLDTALQQKYMSGKNPKDYIYLVYQTDYNTNLASTQPYTVKQTITNLDDYDAIIVGSYQSVYRFAGITDFRVFGGLEQLESVYNIPCIGGTQISPSSYRTWIVVAYPKEKFLKPGATLIEEGTQIKGVLKVELTGVDYSKDPKSAYDSATLENTYSYRQAMVIQVPKGYGYMTKGQSFSPEFGRYGVPFQILENDKSLNLIRSDREYYNPLYNVRNLFQAVQFTQSQSGCSVVINPPNGYSFGDEVPGGSGKEYTLTGSVHNGGTEPLELPTLSLTFSTEFWEGLSKADSSILIDGIPAAQICKPDWNFNHRILTIGFNTILPGQTVNYSLEFKPRNNTMIPAPTPVLGGGYGKRNYTVEMIDDLVIIDDKKLDINDYDFTSFIINTYEESYYSLDTGGRMTGLVSRDYDNYSPVEVQAKTRSSSAWHKIGEIKMASNGDCIYTPIIGKPTAWDINSPGGNPTNTAPLPEGTYAIKLICESNKYSIDLTYNVNMALNPTQTIKDLIKNKDSIQLYNVSTALFKDADGVIHPLASSEVGNDSAIIDIVKAHDTAQGYPVNQSHAMKNDTVYRKTDGATEIFINANSPSNEGPNYWGVQQQRIDAFDQIATNYGASIQEYIDYGMFKHQTEGTFYVLFPVGTTFRPGSIEVAQRGYLPSNGQYPRVKDENIQIRTVPNWQNSGQTMLIVHVKLPEGTENISTTYSSASEACRMSGFQLSYVLINPYDNMHDNGRSVVTQIAYRSGNPKGLSQGKEAEFPYFQNLEGGPGRDDGNKNTVYTSLATTFNPVSAALFGFTKSVQAAGAPSFTAATDVSFSGEYIYRLRIASGTSGSRSGKIVFYDVLDSGNGTDPNNWKGTLERIDLSHAKSKGIKPVVYYSTSTSLDPASPPAIPNQVWTVWSNLDVVPSGITAVAIDFSKDESGADWYLKGSDDSLYCLLHMRAPSGPSSIAGNKAYNRAFYRMQNDIIVGANLPATSGPTSFTQVTLRAPDVDITKTSNPASGTITTPVTVSENSPIVYTISLTNKENVVINNVKITDTIPAGLTIDYAKIQYSLAGVIAPITESTPVKKTESGQKLTFTVNSLAIGQTVQVIIPTTVTSSASTDQIVNTARVIEVNGVVFEFDSNSTYHRLAFAGTVTYNGNGNTGGSVPVDTTSYKKGDTVTVKGNAGASPLVRTGYSFLGWAANSTAEVPDFAVSSDGRTVTPATFTISTAGVILYAVWGANSYDVTYTLTGSDKPANIEKMPEKQAGIKYGTVVSVAGNPETYDRNKDSVLGAWKFSGWSTTDATVSEGGTFTMPAKNVAFTGSWTFTANGYFNVIYKFDGTVPAEIKGMPESLIQVKQEGERVTIADDPTSSATEYDGKQGTWSFNGWKPVEDIVMTRGVNGVFIMPGYDVNFIGSWTFTPKDKPPVDDDKTRRPHHNAPKPGATVPASVTSAPKAAGSGSPGTGDNNKIGLLTILLAVSGLLLLCLVILPRRYKARSARSNK